MDILPATEADIPALTQVEIQSKKESIPEQVDEIEVDYPRRLQRWQTYFRGESPGGSKPERLVLKAVVDGRLIGHLAGHLTTRYDMDAEIQSFYILKEHQRRNCWPGSRNG